MAWLFPPPGDTYSGRYGPVRIRTIHPFIPYLAKQRGGVDHSTRLYRSGIDYLYNKVIYFRYSVIPPFTPSYLVREGISSRQEGIKTPEDTIGLIQYNPTLPRIPTPETAAGGMFSGTEGRRPARPPPDLPGYYTIQEPSSPKFPIPVGRSPSLVSPPFDGISSLPFPDSSQHTTSYLTPSFLPQSETTRSSNPTQSQSQ